MLEEQPAEQPEQTAEEPEQEQSQVEEPEQQSFEEGDTAEDNAAQRITMTTKTTESLSTLFFY